MPHKALLSLVLEIGLGLLVALTLHRRFPLRGLVRTLVLMNAIRKIP